MGRSRTTIDVSASGGRETVGRRESSTRTIVVVGSGRWVEVTAAGLAAAAIRRDGYGLLSAAQAGTSRLSGPGFAVVHHLSTGPRELVVAATGQTPDWSQIIERSDQLVVATTAAAAGSDAGHLRALQARGGRAAELVSGAVVVVAGADLALGREAGAFAGLARATVAVPHDPGAPTDPLQPSPLPPATRGAWDRAAELVGSDEVPLEDADTQPRIDVRSLMAEAPATDAPTSGQTGTWIEGPPRPKRRRWILLAIAAALIAVLALTPFVLGGGWPWGGPSAAPSGVSPVTPVQGWTDQATWVSPDLASGEEAPTVLVSGDAVITASEGTSSPELLALSSTDGAELWSSPIDGALTGPPQLITWQDKPAVVAATSNELYLWADLEGEAPAPRTWSFTEADVRLVPGSPVPLLANEETLTALVLTGDGLQRRSLPSGGQPIAADAEGQVMSVGPSGHWWSSTDDGQVSDGTLLTPPVYGSLPGRVLGVGGTTLVVNWTRNNRATYLAGYDITNGMNLTWKTTVQGRVDLGDFDTSPDGTWAAVGTQAVDLSSGETTPLADDWQTVRVLDDRAWGTKHAVDKGGAARPLDEPIGDPAGVPVAVTDSGLGLIVAAEDGGALRIYALQPDPDA